MRKNFIQNCIPRVKKETANDRGLKSWKILRLKVISLASNVYVKGFVSETTDKALLAPGKTADLLGHC